MLFRLHALDDLQVQRAICERKTEKCDFAVFPGVVKPPVKQTPRFAVPEKKNLRISRRARATLHAPNTASRHHASLPRPTHFKLMRACAAISSTSACRRNPPPMVRVRGGGREGPMGGEHPRASRHSACERVVRASPRSPCGSGVVVWR